MITRIIGIDLGTSTTVVRVHNVGVENRIVPVTVNGQRTIPTIAFQPDGSTEIYYGYDAQAKRDSLSEGVLYKNFKMDLISDDVNKRELAETLICGFLRYVYGKYQSLLNDGVFDRADEVKVYVSHPAKWNSHARTLMKRCVEAAGFCKQDNIILKDEPTAAILAVIHEKKERLGEMGMLIKNKQYKAMMIDMGAGTTDIVLCSYMVTDEKKLNIENIFTYPSISNSGLCGGREIDDIIVREVQKFTDEMQKKPSRTKEKAVKKFAKGAKKWKETVLSDTLAKNSDLPEPEAIADFRDHLSDSDTPIMNEGQRFSVGRELFENFTRKHWEQWVGLLDGAFSEVKGEQYKDLNCPKCPEEVDLLIITGGHSKWYLVSEYLLGKKSFINLPPANFEKILQKKECFIQSVDPQETVAVGLCHLGEDVVGTLAASNDVAISFTCEGKYLGACDLIKKGIPLPYEKGNFSIRNVINGNFIYRRELKIEYTIVTDNTNTIIKAQTVPSTGILETILRATLATLGVAVFDVPKIIWYFLTDKLDLLDDTVLFRIINNKYNVELAPMINVNEEGIIKIGGKISVDGRMIDIPELLI